MFNKYLITLLALTFSAASWSQPIDFSGNDLMYSSGLPNNAPAPSLPIVERSLLVTYLGNPNNARHAAGLGAIHYQKFLLKRKQKNRGDTIRHGIIATYFFERSIKLDKSSKLFVGIPLADISLYLKQQLPASSKPTYHQDVAHDFFIEAFNYHEENRYIAVDLLLQDLANNPHNTLTSAYLTASNIWLGGEAGYDDPSILYHFILSSYFSVRTVAMARKMEELWKKNPNKYSRFRLAPILGGWTVPARRWLAKLHGDTGAVNALDEEHRHWLALNRVFHSASVGLMLFPENENFLEAFNAWDAGNIHCQEIPDMNACQSLAKFSFNNIAFFGGQVDFFIKAGMFDYAQYFLSTWKHVPPFAYNDWDLGRKLWEHREQNMFAMHELFNNDNPNDDPVHMLLKRHKWGPDTITCQLCHQAQSRVWTEEQKSIVYYPHESVATINNWPLQTTTWIGSLSKSK